MVVRSAAAWTPDLAGASILGVEGEEDETRSGSTDEVVDQIEELIDAIEEHLGLDDDEQE